MSKILLIFLFYISRFFTSFAFVCINFLLGATSSHIRTLKISSAFCASQIETLYIFLTSGSIVVAQSSSGFISQRPLYL